MITEYSVTLENKTKGELILFINELQDMLKEKDKKIESLEKTLDKRFIYVTGRLSSQDYRSAILEGGQKYYLHLGYRKDSSGDSNDDRIVFNSIKVYGGTNETYNFVENNGKYEIIGLDIGLRKINVNYASKLRAQNYDMSTLQVMNNKTGEFESLQEYINTYINNSEE